MAIILVKNGTADEFSFGGSGLDPISTTVTLDDTNSPTTIDGTTVTAQIKATTYNYTGIAMSIQTEEAGIDYKLSLNNTNWFDALTSGVGGAAAGQIANMDATGAEQNTLVYIKAVVNNSGSVSSGNKTGAKVRLVATENQ